jgi:hypothetical protein
MTRNWNSVTNFGTSALFTCSSQWELQTLIWTIFAKAALPTAGRTNPIPCFNVTAVELSHHQVTTLTSHSAELLIDSKWSHFCWRECLSDSTASLATYFNSILNKTYSLCFDYLGRWFHVLTTAAFRSSMSCRVLRATKRGLASSIMYKMYLIFKYNY